MADQTFTNRVVRTAGSPNLAGPGRFRNRNGWERN